MQVKALRLWMRTAKILERLAVVNGVPSTGWSWGNCLGKAVTGACTAAPLTTERSRSRCAAEPSCRNAPD